MFSEDGQTMKKFFARKTTLGGQKYVKLSEFTSVSRKQQ
jgi:hypothetical protein